MFKPRTPQEETFVNTPFYFSYSSLNKLIFSPRIFYNQYILKIKEEKTESYLIDGRIIHCLLLEEDKFNEQFTVLPLKLPSESNRKVIDLLYETNKDVITETSLCKLFFNEIIQILKDINLHQSLKTDQQRLDKILTPENITYFDFLKTKGNKTLIDQQTLDRCKRGVDLIKQDQKISEKLITKSTWELLECFNETELRYEDDSLGFGLKGILDNFTVDYVNKVVTINDLKTTSKSLTDFKDSIEFYNYWLQAAIYHTLVQKVVVNKLEDPQSWKIKFNFIVYDAYEQVYCFPVSENTMDEWKSKFIQKLYEAKYHLDTGEFSLPYLFASGQVIL